MKFSVWGNSANWMKKINSAMPSAHLKQFASNSYMGYIFRGKQFGADYLFLRLESSVAVQLDENAVMRREHAWVHPWWEGSMLECIRDEKGACLSASVMDLLIMSSLVQVHAYSQFYIMSLLSIDCFTSFLGDIMIQDLQSTTSTWVVSHGRVCSEYCWTLNVAVHRS